MRVVAMLSAILVVAAAAAWAAEKADEPRVSVNVVDGEINGVLRMIFDRSGASFVLADDLRGTVTARIDDRPLGEVLRSILSPRGLVWRKVDKTYIVSKKEEPKQEDKDRVVKLPEGPDRRDDGNPAVEDTVIEMIPLNFIDARDLLAIIQGTGGTEAVRGYGSAVPWDNPGSQWGQWGSGFGPYGGPNGYNPTYRPGGPPVGGWDGRNPTSPLVQPPGRPGTTTPAPPLPSW